ncbi:MAG: HAD-IIB family hydrolase [Nitrospirota bacterium]
MPTRLVVFTDLDGSLLDARSYSFAAAREALGALRASGAPLVLVSSKTRAEIESIRYRLEHRHPFVVENGGAVVIPTGYFGGPVAGAAYRGPYQVIELGVSYERLRSALREIAKALGCPLRGFGDMAVGEIASRTGLSLADAALAKQREYDEPFVVEGRAAPLKEIGKQAEARGLRCTRGGRFFHLTGDGDKGRACRLLIDAYRRLAPGGDRLVTAGIGDSLNDLPMLAVVDRPVLVRRPDGSYDPEASLPNLLRAPGIGPAGWNQAVRQLLLQKWG